MTRRNFLMLSSLGGAAALITACGADTAPPVQTPTTAQATVGAAPVATGVAPTVAVQPTSAGSASAAPSTASGGAASSAPSTPSAFKEAPQLAQLVKDGKLPAVAERLPKKPLVLTPLEKIGKYGGTWRNALLGGSDLAQLHLTIGYEHIVRWDPEWKAVIPNVAESFESNADGTEFTFRLREGHKWSDGKPFTADDVIFWWEDYALDPDISPGGVAAWLKAGGKNMTIEKVNDTTFKCKFAAPNGLFLQNLCTYNAYQMAAMPKHYLQQFHKKYNPQGIDQLAKAANQDTWVKLFQTKGAGIPGTPYNALWQNADLPTLNGWMITTPYTGTTRVAAERNPYYFKVDTAGNQLPYIDKYTAEPISDQETMTLKALNGELDLVYHKVNTLTNKPLFTDNLQRANLKFYETIGAGMNSFILALNLNAKDQVKRQIFQNKDFRIGLSHAINRQEIIDIVFVGQGEPWQGAPRKESPYYNERLAKQYTEFDLAKANAALDKAFPQKNAQGVRLGPNGQPISFLVEVAGTVNQAWLDTINLIKTMWQKVGVEIQVKNEDRALFYSRKDANEHEAAIWGGDGGLRDGLLDPRWYFPFNNESLMAQAWRYWYNPPGQLLIQPEEPPAEVKKQMALYDQIKGTVDEAKQTQYMKEIIEIAADQFYCFGIVLPPTGYGLHKANLKNVPTKRFAAWLFQDPGVTNTSTYFFE